MKPRGQGSSELAAKVGGVLAVLLGLGLAVMVVVRDVDFNWLNLITILGAVVAGVIVIARPRQAGALGLAGALLVVAAYPALFGGLGLLLIPSLGLMIAAILMRRTTPNRAHRPWPTPIVMCAAALTWSVAVIAGGFFVPAYTSEGQSCQASPSGSVSCTRVHRETSTLIEGGGLGVVPWLAIPAVATVLVTLFVWSAWHGARIGRPLAWVLIGLLWAVTVLTGFSIGLFYIPTVTLLTLAAALPPASSTSTESPAQL